MNYIDQIATAVEHRIPSEKRPDEAALALYRQYALLVLTTGTGTTLEDIHNAWSVWIVERGIRHESLVPFGALSPDVQQEDVVYQHAVRAVAEDRRK